jgi:tRNA(Ile)-lysidine synthetase-like protein
MFSSQKFLFHVEKFIREHTGPKPYVAIAVSGGMDSMCLAFTLLKLKSRLNIQELRLLFFHHHTRPGQELDLALVQKFAQQYNLSLEVGHGRGLQGSNFEARAREQRYQWFKKIKKNGEQIFLAHHLDDAFEWWMMQEGRSSHGLNLGMPLIHGPFFRPFFCVSKKQIRHMIKAEKIPYREDPSNTDTKFLRNHLRQKLIPPWKKLFQGSLTLFVNKMLERKDIYLALKIQQQKSMIETEEGVLWLGSPRRLDLRQICERLSSRRGNWGSEFKKIQIAQRAHKKGPYHLTGGLKVYLSPYSVWIGKKSLVAHYHWSDWETVEMDKNQFQDWVVRQVKSHATNWKFPYVVLAQKKWQKSEGLGKDLNQLRKRWEKDGFYLHSAGFILSEWPSDLKLRLRLPRV